VLLRLLLGWLIEILLPGHHRRVLELSRLLLRQSHSQLLLLQASLDSRRLVGNRAELHCLAEGRFLAGILMLLLQLVLVRHS